MSPQDVCALIWEVALSFYELPMQMGSIGCLVLYLPFLYLPFLYLPFSASFVACSLIDWGFFIFLFPPFFKNRSTVNPGLVVPYFLQQSAPHGSPLVSLPLSFAVCLLFHHCSHHINPEKMASELGINAQGMKLRKLHFVAVYMSGKLKSVDLGKLQIPGTMTSPTVAYSVRLCLCVCVTVCDCVCARVEL